MDNVIELKRRKDETIDLMERMNDILDEMYPNEEKEDEVL